MAVALPRFAASFRLRILLAIVLVAVIPLGLVGIWTAQRASRAGEELLRARIDEALNFTGARALQRWAELRSRLLDLADDEAVRQSLTAASPDLPDNMEPPTGLVFTSISLRHSGGRELSRLAVRSEAGDFAPPGIEMIVPVHESALGAAIGSIHAIVPVISLVPPERPRPGSIGAIVGIYDESGRTPFVPLPFDPSTSGDRIMWGGDEWLIVSRTLSEAPLRLVGAAPLSPFQAPARQAARDSLVILLVVSGLGIVLMVLLTTQMTRSLERLAAAADAVAAGDLERKAEESGVDEVGRVGRAFNKMTTSLRATLQELAEQRALARVGEFAATLAHEVRNPLSAIRVDLQVAREAIAEESRAARPISRALEQIDRLDRTVGATLLATRASRHRVDLRTPLAAACQLAASAAPRPLSIEPELPDDPVFVPGDAAALEQVFLNILLNATEAVRDAGDIRVSLSSTEDVVEVRIEDTGVGLSADLAARAFEPFFTTRTGGTGLGLTIASRLARAHGGSITLAGTPGSGATATVSLPRFDLDVTPPGRL